MDAPKPIKTVEKFSPFDGKTEECGDLLHGGWATCCSADDGDTILVFGSHGTDCRHTVQTYSVFMKKTTSIMEIPWSSAYNDVRAALSLDCKTFLLVANDYTAQYTRGSNHLPTLRKLEAQRPLPSGLP